MAAPAKIIHLSSKGQIVIPAAFRRRLGLKTGQPLSVRQQKGGEIVLEPLGRGALDADEMRLRLQAATAALGRDLVEELHERRRQERILEERKYGRRRH